MEPIDIVLQELRELKQDIRQWHQNNESCHKELTDKVQRLEVNQAEGKVKLGVIVSIVTTAITVMLGSIIKKLGF